MLRQGNLLVMEMRDCISCDGKGTRKEYVPCANYGKAMYRKTCPHCGSTTKQGHHYIEKGKITTCGSCKGTGKVMENLYDFSKEEIWQSLNFKVYRNQRDLSWNEEYLAMGCAYSCTDYGRAYSASDEEVIEEVKKHRSIQAIHFTNKETSEVCDHLGIFIARNGYSVRAVFLPQEAKEIEKQIASEPSQDEVLAIYSALKEKGIAVPLTEYATGKS